MTRIEIARGGGFHLISYGNGTFYALSLDGAADADCVFVQGDDATAFREQWESIESAFPHLHTAGCLAKLWNLYR